MSWYRVDPAQRRATLTLHVQPNARVSAVAGRHGDAIRLKVAAPAVDDKANAAVVRFLHEWLKLPLQQIRIKRGARSRRKIVELENPGAAVLTLLASIESACPTN
jgi:uncharacterized protein (TIGR00251 family)